MDELRFDDTVAIITGAGRGLGREYALLLASRGAKVVVNDLGVAISDTDGVGEAPATNPADEVVAEITAAGGEAVANHDSVATTEGGAAIVATALDTWGKVDVVVNNAGQVRLQPFADFPDEHIATVISTQLLGALNVSRPAWRAMAAAGGGRFVNVSSGCGLRRVPRQLRLLHGQGRRDRAHPGDGRRGCRGRDRGQRDRPLRQDPARHAASGRSPGARSWPSGSTPARSRRRSPGWRTRRARRTASASPSAPGTSPGSTGRSTGARSTGTRRPRRSRATPTSWPRPPSSRSAARTRRSWPR